LPLAHQAFSMPPPLLPAYLRPQKILYKETESRRHSIKLITINLLHYRQRIEDGGQRYHNAGVVCNEWWRWQIWLRQKLLFAGDLENIGYIRSNLFNALSIQVSGLVTIVHNKTIDYIPLGIIRVFNASLNC